MVLTNCPNCGNKVSDRAEACPHCGHNISTVKAWPEPQHKPVVNDADDEKGNSKALLYTIIGLLSLIIIGFGVYIFTSGNNRSTHEDSKSDDELNSNDLTSYIASDYPSVDTQPVIDNAYNQTSQEASTTETEVYIDLTENGEYYLTGTVAGLGCKMYITINDYSINGYYSYNKYNKPLGLEGSIEGNEVQLCEFDEDGGVTGVLNGYMNGNTFTGTHTRYSNSRNTKFSFKAQ